MVMMIAKNRVIQKSKLQKHHHHHQGHLDRDHHDHDHGHRHHDGRHDYALDCSLGPRSNHSPPAGSMGKAIRVCFVWDQQVSQMRLLLASKREASVK